MPTRPVVGFWAESGQPTHVWAEFYLPGYGWVLADPERGITMGNTAATTTSPAWMGAGG